MSEPMKVMRGQALAALAFCGYKSMGEFDNDRLGKKLGTYHDLWPKGETPPADIAEMVEGMRAHAEAGGKFEVTDDVKAEVAVPAETAASVVAESAEAAQAAEPSGAAAVEPTEKKRGRGRPKKEKTEKVEGEPQAAESGHHEGNGESKTKRPRKLGGHTFDYQAGRLMRKYGGAVEKITPEMVQEYLQMRGQTGVDKEARQARVYLGWANNILRAYFETETTPAAQSTAEPATTA